MVRAVKMFPHGLRSIRAKDFKTLVLAAFFRYFLPLLAESTPSEAWQGMRWAAGHMGPALQKIFVGRGPRALPGGCGAGPVRVVR